MGYQPSGFSPNSTHYTISADQVSSNSIGTTYYNPQTPNVQYGWACPRCGKINAPWASQCQCAKQQCTITCTDTFSQAQCDSETFKIHPDSTTYQVGGSDYKEGNAYVNVGGTQSNKVEPDVTARSCTNPNNCYTPHYTTETHSYTIHESN